MKCFQFFSTSLLHLKRKQGIRLKQSICLIIYTTNVYSAERFTQLYIAIAFNGEKKKKIRKYSFVSLYRFIFIN